MNSYLSLILLLFGAFIQLSKQLTACSDPECSECGTNNNCISCVSTYWLNGDTCESIRFYNFKYAHRLVKNARIVLLHVHHVLIHIIWKIPHAHVYNIFYD